MRMQPLQPQDFGVNEIQISQRRACHCQWTCGESRVVPKWIWMSTCTAVQLQIVIFKKCCTCNLVFFAHQRGPDVLSTLCSLTIDNCFLICHNRRTLSTARQHIAFKHCWLTVWTEHGTHLSSQVFLFLFNQPIIRFQSWVEIANKGQASALLTECDTANDFKFSSSLRDVFSRGNRGDKI